MKMHKRGQEALELVMKLDKAAQECYPDRRTQRIKGVHRIRLTDLLGKTNTSITEAHMSKREENGNIDLLTDAIKMITPAAEKYNTEFARLVMGLLVSHQNCEAKHTEEIQSRNEALNK
jgi:hypothetical protein